MTHEPLPHDELEDRRDNATPRCSGCGCLPRLERDGLTHWHHEAGCPVMERIRKATEPEDA